jgi:hypothetical protein
LALANTDFDIVLHIEQPQLIENNTCCFGMSVAAASAYQE